MFDAMLECMYRTPEKKKIVQTDQAGNLVTTLTYESEFGNEEEPTESQPAEATIPPASANPEGVSISNGLS
jgi:hypothetical protein